MLSQLLDLEFLVMRLIHCGLSGKRVAKGKITTSFPDDWCCISFQNGSNADLDFRTFIGNNVLILPQNIAEISKSVETLHDHLNNMKCTAYATSKKRQRLEKKRLMELDTKTGSLVFIIATIDGAASVVNFVYEVASVETFALDTDFSIEEIDLGGRAGCEL